MAAEPHGGCRRMRFSSRERCCDAGEGVDLVKAEQATWRRVGCATGGGGCECGGWDLWGGVETVSRQKREGPTIRWCGRMYRQAARETQLSVILTRIGQWICLVSECVADVEIRASDMTADRLGTRSLRGSADIAPPPSAFAHPDRHAQREVRLAPSRSQGLSHRVSHPSCIFSTTAPRLQRQNAISLGALGVRHILFLLVLGTGSGRG